MDTAVVEVDVQGRWCRPLAMEVYLALRDCMAEHPLMVVVDLTGLIDPEAASTAMWLAAARAARALKPPPRLVLSLPPTRQLASHLRRLGATTILSIYPTMKQARVATESRLPVLNRLHLKPLRPVPGSADVAGEAVAVACAAWRLPDLVDPGRQIVMEMVANAVRHAGTDMALTMSVRGTGLHLAVYDGDGRLPGGLGLPTVESRASAWGAMPTRDGKVVWALVHPRSGRST